VVGVKNGDCSMAQLPAKNGARVNGTGVEPLKIIE
jgi:hypothetical protein